MKIIGIAGKKRSGKTTFAQALYTRHALVEVMSFADPVYAAIEAIIGEIEDDAKEAPIEWLDGITPRRMLQTLGTEWGRALHPDLWVLLMRNRLKALEAAEKEAPDARQTVVVIPDVRFENEATLIRELGGLIVHVTRPGLEAVDTHVSEAGINLGQGDLVAYNSDDLEFWNQAAERIYQQVVHGGQV